MATNANTAPLMMKRTAVDTFGRLGSLYDGCQDRVLKELNTTFEKLPNRFPQAARCILAKGDKNGKRNILELIGIEEQLRLSLLLGITSKNGIASVMTYPQAIDQYTRVIHYTYIHGEEELPDDLQLIGDWLQAVKLESNATHVITGVSWGIDIAIVLQLPTNESLATMIDNTLEKYRAYLNGECDYFKLTREDITAYKKLTTSKIYSNIPILSEDSTLHDIFHSLTRRKMDPIEHQQISYTLCPLQWFQGQSSPLNYRYVPLDLTDDRALEHYVADLSSSWRTLETYFNEDLPGLLCGHFKERLTSAYQQQYSLINEYKQLIDRLSMLIIEMRSGSIAYSPLDDELQNEEQVRLKASMRSLIHNVADLNAKGHLISDLGHQEIQYCNVVERHVNESDNEESLKTKLIVDQASDRVLCSNDTLNKNNPEQLKELRHALLEELTHNPKLRLTYADFSYCTFDLSNMIILPFSKYYIKKRPKLPELTLTADITSSMSSVSTVVIASPATSPTPQVSESINILLLGETGVGKSTFINSFVNYVTFNTLEKVRADKPIVPIPASFFIAVGDNFEERLVKSEDPKNSKNEDFNHPGRSVTQHCRSYIFHPNHTDRRKLRLIDTPGFGDTRGADHDNLAMQYIFEYIKKLSHLSAICILLKPNESVLNESLSSCLTQLYQFFGSSVRRNIIFCFTHARPTAYTPGHTTALLKEMLSSLPTRKIPLKKRNIFCFDNEAFRYLIALQNGLVFDDQTRADYETSWTNAVLEANRLIRYIRKNLSPAPIPDEWEAIKRAQIEIVHMIHPLLETIRHILRNIIIRKINSMQASIELHINEVPASPQSNEREHFQRLPYQPIPLDFLENYKIPNSELTAKQEEMIGHLSLLCQLSAEFGYFLANFTAYPNGNPFLSGLFRLINEEKSNCDDHSRSYMNIQLLDGLKALRNNYEQCMKTFKADGKRCKLADIHGWINYMHEYPLVTNYVVASNGIDTTLRSEILMD